jgi:hypothetical protein
LKEKKKSTQPVSFYVVVVVESSQFTAHAPACPWQVNWRNPDAHERTAVMAASFRGQLHTLKWLVLENHARVTGSDDLGCTALNLACRGGYPKVRCQREQASKTLEP